jgi:hypothetical protein
MEVMADLIVEVLWQGYFKQPYYYKGFVRGDKNLLNPPFPPNPQYPRI